MAKGIISAMVKGITNAFDHMELWSVINLTKSGNWATG